MRTEQQGSKLLLQLPLKIYEINIEQN